jgi:hypothetical protein
MALNLILVFMVCECNVYVSMGGKYLGYSSCTVCPEYVQYALSVYSGHCVHRVCTDSTECAYCEQPVHRVCII